MNKGNTGIVFNIQRYSVNDGPGIRTTVFLKGCPLRCKWCSNPESQLIKPQVLYHADKCIGCHHCIEVCPTHAIDPVPTYIIVGTDKCHIHINHSKCDGCSKCTKECVVECPVHALTIEGETKTVDEVMAIVLKDKDFYEESGGGMTLSGGEMLYQPDFAINLLIAAKQSHIHTCCETTGFATSEIFDKVIEYVDYVLFDMKHYNKQKHIEGTGTSNDLCISNMKQAIASGKTVLPRIPVIPGFNDSLEDAIHFASLLHELGADRCQLLPFHQFGENKYGLLSEKYAYENVPSLHREDLEDYKNKLVEYGIEAFF